MTVSVTEVDRLAKILWDYHHMGHPLRTSDAILVLCSFDPRVAECGAQLWLDGLGEYLIFSGGLGRDTKGKLSKPEAQIFAAIARDMGVPESAILIEDRSTNTGENIRFTHQLLQKEGLQPRSLILVQKPTMERRTYAVFKKQWPGQGVDILVTSPQIKYEAYYPRGVDRRRFLNNMVGDLQRIKEYPAFGYHIAQAIPPEVWGAYEQLVALGYDQQLIPAEELRLRRRVSI